jgi:hypothetical protein
MGGLESLAVYILGVKVHSHAELSRKDVPGYEAELGGLLDLNPTGDRYDPGKPRIACNLPRKWDLRSSVPKQPLEIAKLCG